MIDYSNSLDIGLTNLLKLQSLIMNSLRSFFLKRGYVECFVEGITKVTGSCESIANIFTIDELEFSTLRQTAQLEMEGLLINSGLTKMFTSGRSFRKEINTRDGRHLSDFELFEYEAIDQNLEELVEFNNDLMIHLISDTLSSNLLSREQQNNLKNYLDKLLRMVRISINYSEAINFLTLKKVSVIENGKKRIIKYGDDLNAESESLLTKEFGIIQVTHYPEHIKFFNMLRSRGVQYAGSVDCVDLLLPYAGETIGGSAREYDFDILSEKLNNSLMLKHLNQLAKEKNWNGKVIEVFQPYLELFREKEYPRAGAGLGMARLLQFLLSSPSIISF